MSAARASSHHREKPQRSARVLSAIKKNELSCCYRDAKLAERYGGVLGLPVSLLISRDGRIYAKHVAETDISLIEQEINSLL